MKKILKASIWTLLILSTLGFRTYGNITWDISSSDTKVFVRFCQTYAITTNDLPSGDPLFGTAVTFSSLVQSIYDDYNNLASTYFQLVDISDPEFNATTHANRIIDVCIGSPSAPVSGGEASLTTSGDTITGCDVKLISSVTDSAKDFVKVLTHELGHCMGLDHPQDSTTAIMSYFSGEDVVRLQVDDKMGLTHLYPVDPSLAEETVTFGLSCTPKD